MAIAARTRTLILTLLATAGLSVAASPSFPGADEAGPRSSRPIAEARLTSMHPGATFFRTGSTVTTISGAELSFGASPVDSAESFLQTHGDVLGIARGELTEGSLAADGAGVRGVMPERDAQGRWTGGFKFTLVSYLQNRDGIPVYLGNVRLLAANEANSPVTLVRSGLRTLGAFRPDLGVAGNPNVAAALTNAKAKYPGIGDFTAPQVVIFAGDDVSRPVAPKLAVVFEGTIGSVVDAGYSKYRIVADAATGAIIFSDSMIHHTDVSGQITGVSTDGIKSAECNTESSRGLPYARASIGATTVYANATGNFTIPNAGTSAVTVTGSLQGKYFNVYTPTNLEPTLTASVTPPGPANIQFNAANTNETRRASVNAYYQANVVRDFLLLHSPGFPTIASQTNFRINVAVSGTCNAFYDGSSLNFYSAGGGCANTAYNDVVHHEYGHHIVQVAGSGQGEYGEGTGDCMGVLISDQSVLGYGFQNNCAVGIRDANNSCQYDAGACSSCGSEIHACGQLISGCVWSLRNNLLASNPSDYKTILADLVTNAVLLHDGTSIDAQIYTDYLTLDGGAHTCQINNAFAAHGLAAAGGAGLAITIPSGTPSLISPAGGVIGTVQVGAQCGQTPQPNTGVLFVDAEDDGTYVPYPLNQISANVYELNFPATACGARVRWYVAATATNAAVTTLPGNAPTSYYVSFVGSGVTVAFNDNFETDQGWVATVSGATTGQWQRGVPADPFGSAPGTDYDGSGQCFVTDNRVGTTVGSYDIDGGSVILTSPTLDASSGEAYLSYARWYDNTGAGGGGDPHNDLFVIQLSNNNGGSWVGLETVGPTVQSSGGWNTRIFRLSNTLPLTNQMKVRFNASDLNTGSVVEAAVDAVKLQIVNCFCPSDYDQNGFVNGDDFDAFVDAFVAGDIAADFDHNTFVNGDDFDGFVSAFEAGC